MRDVTGHPLKGTIRGFLRDLKALQALEVKYLSVVSDDASILGAGGGFQRCRSASTGSPAHRPRWNGLLACAP